MLRAPRATPGLRLADGLAAHLDRLVLRLGIGLLVASVLFVVTLERQAAGETLLALGHVAIVVVASWRFRPAGQWATVTLSAAAWALAGADRSVLAWPPALPPRLWEAGLLRLGVLASVAATVGAFRGAMRRLLRSEDVLALSLLRERDAARRDRLTRLWNARYLDEVLDQEIARCQRYGRPFGLLLVDLDGFKEVNDSCGHQAGDAVLQVVGRILRDNCRATDFPARLGGDEFVIVLPEASSLTVPRYAAKLVELVGRAPLPPGVPRVTASVGGVAFFRAPASAKAALEIADQAMYAAKREGKNRISVIRVEPTR
jgi:diguanylate cyclase (GGDEF)-like protein